MMGRGGSWIGASSGGVGIALARVWLYQDFAAGSGPALTITGNSNGSGITFDSAKIVNSSAVVTKTTGLPIYNSVTEIPANLVSVSAHAAAAVTLDGTPAVGEGGVRIWYLYTFQSTDTPTDLELAPQFVTEARTVYLDLQYLNQGLNLSDLSNAATARTNLGFVAQTAGQVLIGDGSTTFTSEAELFWDTSNNRLGIGINAPSTDLHVYKASAASVATIESQFTSGVPEVKFSAARTTNADLATNDVAARMNFFARYNSTNAAIAKIDVVYTGSGTTQLGDIVLYTANAGSAAEAMRVLASGAVTMQSTLSVVTSVTSPIIYGSASASGNLTLRSTSNATVGIVKIADQTGETTQIGPIGSVTANYGTNTVLVPNSSSLTNSLVVQANGANLAFSGTSGAPGIALIPNLGTLPEIRSASDNGRMLIRSYAYGGGGELGGYIDVAPQYFGFQNSLAGYRVLNISGTTGQSAELAAFYNQTGYANQVAAIGSGGQFRAPAGTVSLPGFAFFGDTNNGWWAPAADTQAWSLAGAEAMRLDSSGLLLKTALVLEDPGAGTNTVTINTGVVSASYTMTMPLLQGAAGTTLVNNGSGVLSWTNPNTGKAGTVALSISTTTKAITFATARSNALYTVVWTFRNTTDSTPAQRAVNVIAQSTTGFTVEWNDALDTANYIGDWAILEHYDP